MRCFAGRLRLRALRLALIPAVLAVSATPASAATPQAQLHSWQARAARRQVILKRDQKVLTRTTAAVTHDQADLAYARKVIAQLSAQAVSNPRGPDPSLQIQNWYARLNNRHLILNRDVAAEKRAAHAVAVDTADLSHAAVLIARLKAKINPDVRFHMAGVDVSNNDGYANFTALHAAGNRFVVLKVNEGTGFIDRVDDADAVHRARAAGLTVGGYDFARPGSASADAEEWVFVHRARAIGLLRKGDLVATLDLEATVLSPSGTRAWANRWCFLIRRDTGRGCLLYTGGWFVEGSLGNLAPAGNVRGVWDSYYPVRIPFFGSVIFGPAMFAPFHGWDVWQYSEFGSEAGIYPLDLDVFQGTRARWHALLVP